MSGDAPCRPSLLGAFLVALAVAGTITWRSAADALARSSMLLVTAGEWHYEAWSVVRVTPLWVGLLLWLVWPALLRLIRPSAQAPRLPYAVWSWIVALAHLPTAFASGLLAGSTLVASSAPDPFLLGLWWAALPSCGVLAYPLLVCVGVAGVGRKALLAVLTVAPGVVLLLAWEVQTWEGLRPLWGNPLP